METSEISGSFAELELWVQKLMLSCHPLVWMSHLNSFHSDKIWNVDQLLLGWLFLRFDAFLKEREVCWVSVRIGACILACAFKLFIVIESLRADISALSLSRGICEVCLLREKYISLVLYVFHYHWFGTTVLDPKLTLKLIWKLGRIGLKSMDWIAGLQNLIAQCMVI